MLSMMILGIKESELLRETHNLSPKGDQLWLIPWKIGYNLSLCFSQNYYY